MRTMLIGRADVQIGNPPLALYRHEIGRAEVRPGKLALGVACISNALATMWEVTY